MTKSKIVESNYIIRFPDCDPFNHFNKSNSSRRAFVLNVFAEGTISDTNDELLAGVPVVPKGEKMEGQFFPLLFQPC